MDAIPVHIQDPKTGNRLGIFDPIARAIITMDEGHSQVHDGDSYFCTVVSLVLGDADTLVMAFKTKAGVRRAHIITDFTTLIGGKLELLEDTTWDSETGSPVSIFNRKREVGSQEATFLEDNGQPGFEPSDNVIQDPANLTGGVAVQTIHAFGEKNKFSARGRDTEEIILKPDTKYAIRFTAVSGPNNKTQIILNFYDHTDE